MQTDIDIRGDGPVLVFLHGAGVDKSLWMPQLDALSCSFRCIAIDLPGHGGVSAVKDVPAMAEHVRARLQQNGVDQYAVAGLSLGGMVALEMAGRWPDEVTHLIVAESVAQVTRNPVAQFLAAGAIGLLKLISPRLLAAIPAKSMGAATEDAGSYLKSALRKMTRHDNYAVMKAALAYDGHPHLAGLSMPALVMVGELNRQTHKRARDMSNRIPGARFVVIPGAAHIVNRDAPEFFNRTITAFITGHGDQSAPQAG